MRTISKLVYEGSAVEAAERQDENADLDGETQGELEPRPTSHPNDPLKWPRRKKFLVIGHVSAFYFLSAYITTATVPIRDELESLYGLSDASEDLLPALSLALSPLMWAPLADTYGRRTTMIIGCFVAFVASIGASTAPNGAAYSAARFFMGLGAGPASCVGLQMLQDISFKHERGQKVGIWTLAMDSGLLMGPIISNLTRGLYVMAQWIPTIAFGVLFLSFLAFLPETAFPRRFVQMEEATGKAFDIPDPTNVVPEKERPPVLNLQPIPGLVAPRPWDYTLRFFRMFTFPNVAVSVILYAWAWYWVFHFVVTAVPLLGRLSENKGAASAFYIGLIVGTLFSEIFLSGTLSDAIVRYITKTRKTPRNPEMRLWLMWPAAFLTVLGMLLCGQGSAHGWAWATGQLFLATFAVGVQMGNTATITYALECHPEHALDVAVFYSFHTNMSAFASPFLLIPWTSTDNIALVFGGIQGIITACSVIVCLGFLQIFGRKVREKRGPIPWTPAQ